MFWTTNRLAMLAKLLATDAMFYKECVRYDAEKLLEREKIMLTLRIKSHVNVNLKIAGSLGPRDTKAEIGLQSKRIRDQEHVDYFGKKYQSVS